MCIKTSLQALAGTAAALFLAVSGAARAGDLHADVFGNVYDGNDSFAIGELDSSSGEGKLHADVFGNVYAGESPFPVGRIDSGGSSGTLRRDVFGDVYVGDSPFEVDISPIFKD